MKKTEQEKVFAVNTASSNPVISTLLYLLRPPLESILSFPHLNKVYGEIRKKEDSRNFAERTKEALNIAYDISPEDYSRIPRCGPVVVASNHPFGVTEGIVLSCILNSVRSDVKFLANHLLGLIPDIQDMIIFVDPYGRRDSVIQNARALREAIQWVSSGRMLVVFPAGEVSHVQIQSREIADSQWSHTVGGIIRKSRASVLPVFFDGTNSALFQILGLVHPRMRTIMLPRELLNKGKRKICVRVGNPVPQSKLNTFGTDAEKMEYLRLKTYMLRHRNDKIEIEQDGRLPDNARLRRPKTVVPPQRAWLLKQEISSLRKENTLVESGHYAVIHADGSQIPHLLQEIGRLREITFRAAGEGTGGATDLDRFDPYYSHLFVWNKERDELVGAYRFGKTDEILPKSGKHGLYTNTLFRYRKSFLEKISPALELGRSFVRLKYQRNYSPLLLLWKGIGQFIAKNPRYRILFGPVSISRRYHALSRHLILTFLRENNLCNGVASLVRARRPFRGKPVKGWDEKAAKLIKDMDDLSELILDIEAQQRGIPVLLKQYLRLGGRLIDFTVDAYFSEVIDGLMLVDLAQTEERKLKRYMGGDGTIGFLAYHRGIPSSDLCSSLRTGRQGDSLEI